MIKKSCINRFLAIAFHKQKVKCEFLYTEDLQDGLIIDGAAVSMSKCKEWGVVLFKVKRLGSEHLGWTFPAHTLSRSGIELPCNRI